MLMGKIASWITDHVIAFLIISNNIVFVYPVSSCNIIYVCIMSINLQTSQSGTVETIDINCYNKYKRYAYPH